MAEPKIITINDVNIGSDAFLREVAASTIKAAQRQGVRAVASAITSEQIEQARRLVNSYFPPPENGDS